MDSAMRRISFVQYVNTLQSSFFYDHMYGVIVHLQQLESLRGLTVSFKARYSLNSISCAWQPHVSVPD